MRLRSAAPLGMWQGVSIGPGGGTFQRFKCNQAAIALVAKVVARRSRTLCTQNAAREIARGMLPSFEIGDLANCYR